MPSTAPTKLPGESKQPYAHAGSQAGCVALGID